MPFVFPGLGPFETVSDLVTHLCSLDTSFRAACGEEQLELAPPPMWLTLHWLVTRLLDCLSSAHDVLLLKHPTELTVDLLESTLTKIEINLFAVAAATAAVPPHKKGGKGGGGGDGGDSGSTISSSGGGTGGCTGLAGSTGGGAGLVVSLTSPHIPSFSRNLVNVDPLRTYALAPGCEPLLKPPLFALRATRGTTSGGAGAGGSGT
ncbi:unnamed protein product [Closterium sp. NIES-54]